LANDNLNVLIAQAKACYYKNDYAKAFTILQKAILLDSDNQEILLLQGKVAYKLNEKEYCVGILDKLEFDNKNAELLNFIGLIEIYRENFASAETCFKHAINIERSNSQYYYNLANVYLQINKLSLAKKYFNLAISLNPENNDYHFALANVYYAEKSYKRALEELKGDFFEAKLLKSIILYDTGYLALAKKTLLELEKERPEDLVVMEYKKRIEEKLRI
jgi:tetratricopeptide (TPR) repeat protein